MDRIDRAIIDELESDGRLPNVTLADRVHLTPGPCLRRVQRLEAEGVILGYAARVDPAAVGRGFEVILEVSLARFDKATVQRFEETMSAYDEVTELRRMFGTPDYYAKVAVADQTAYEVFLTDRVMTLDGIATVSSKFAMKVLKPAP
ncbi:MAG: Lrp/AsnC family transcriptional regulator [Gordonia sp. (in: high G+C Gram-positive bacteria)]|uniref:Lrp/AsnC family transcriptional regulator n=1 Tax=Gordonia sp. (in: high G+C Gram-positive bacteria) TaxID=84139 RepID=UPI0039E26CC3